MKAGKWEKGFWIPTLYVNNPQGYNKHKRNPKPIAKPLTQEEVFMKLSKEEQYKEIKRLGYVIYIKSKELTPIKKKFNMMQKLYFEFNWGE